MRCTTHHHFDLSGHIFLQHHDNLTPAELRNLWLGGDDVSARHAASNDKDGKPRFGGADFVAVTIDLGLLSVTEALNAGFTCTYCTLAAFPDHAVSDGVCVLVFQLPHCEADAKQYTLLLAGLETLYAGARAHRSVLQTYGDGTLEDRIFYGHALDDQAVRYLKRLGVETKTIQRKPDGLLRSTVAIEPDTVIRLADRSEEMLDRVQEDVRVFCPVHADRRATALIYRLQDDRHAVACVHCERTYAVPEATARYDFDHFDRVLRELAEGQVAATFNDGAFEYDAAPQVQFMRERFLPDLPLEPGVLCVKSPKGSGKTEQLVNIVKRCNKYQNVVLFGHRRALLQSMSARLGLECYFLSGVRHAGADVVGSNNAGAETDDAVIEKIGPKRRYAICLDSMPDLNPRIHRWSVVIIDEAEQVFGHLVGGTLKERRREVFHRLRHYLRMAQTVILLDADLGMITMDALFACDLKPDTSIRFLVNEPVGAGGEIKLYEDRGHLVERLREAVRAGEKCYVATNSKTKAEELQTLLQRENPERNIVCVHSGNSSRNSIQGLLRNIVREFETKIDVLIASPSLGTGVDITFHDGHSNPKTVVRHAFGLFAGNITTHMDIDQQLMRVRHPGQVHVWVDPRELNYETDVHIIKGELGRTVRQTHDLIGFDDDGSPIFPKDSGLIDVWARVAAAQRGSKNRLAALFTQQRRDDGWRVTVVGKDQGAGKAGAEALRQGRDARLQDRAARILGADKFANDADAARLKAMADRGQALSDSQQAQLDRYRIEQFYGEEISNELVELDDEGRTRKAIFNLECLLSSGESNLVRDHRDLHEKWEPDRGARLVRAELLGILLESAGLFDRKRLALNDGALVEQKTLKRFHEKLAEHSARFESVFELPMRSDAEAKRVQQLGAVLDLVGLRFGRVKTVDHAGRKVRWYGLDADRLRRLLEIVERRQQPWLGQDSRPTILERAQQRADAERYGEERQVQKERTWLESLGRLREPVGSKADI